MSDPHIEKHEGVYAVAGTRVSLDSIVYAFLSGQSAEAIAQTFPVLSRHGSIVHSEQVTTFLEFKAWCGR